MTQAAPDRHIAHRVPVAPVEVDYQIPGSTGSERPLSSKGMRVGAGALLAATLLTAGGLTYRAMNSGGEGTPPVAAQPDQDTDTATDQDQPTAVATPEAAPTDLPTIEVEQGTEQYDFRLRAEDYVDNPNQIIVDYYAKITELVNTGISEGDYDSPERFAPGVTDEIFVEQRTAESRAAFADQLMAPGWESNPELALHVEAWGDMHRIVENRDLDTMSPNWEGDRYEAGWRPIEDSIRTTVDDATGLITLTYAFEAYDNQPGKKFNTNPSLDLNDLSGFASVIFSVDENGFLQLESVPSVDAG